MALQPHEVHLDLKLVPLTAIYNAVANVTTFTTSVPFYGNRVVRLLTGTIGTLTKTGPTTFTTTGNFTGGDGAIMGSIAEMTAELSEVVVRDQQDQPELGPEALVRRMVLVHRNKTGFQVTVSHNDPVVRPDETKTWNPDITADPTREIGRFMVPVGAAAERSTVTIREPGYKQVHVHGLEYELEIMEGLR